MCVVPFKLKFGPTLAHVKITKILNRLAFRIFEGDSVQIKLVTCFLSNPNLSHVSFKWGKNIFSPRCLVLTSFLRATTERINGAMCDVRISV